MAAIGVYGGSFNPPHRGHVQAVRWAQQELGLQKVLVVPAAQPPHKVLPEGSPDPETRLELTKLAMAGLPGVQVLDTELCRSGKSYTSDTLRELQGLYPQDTLYLLMGTDMFLSLHTWHEPETICALAVPVVWYRASQDKLEPLEAQAANLEERFGCRSRILHNPVLELSSTTVRRMLTLQAGAACLPENVWAVVRDRRLYGLDRSLRGLPLAELQTQALALYEERRIPHALGVTQTAADLARRWGEDPDMAARAGLLHDVTKAERGPEQLQLCATYGIVAPAFDEAHPSLLHSLTAAGAARQVFGECPAVCGAIRWHTTGRPGMTTLEKIIYLADYIEPNRSFAGLEQVRQVSYENLDRAVALAMEGSLQDLAHRGISASSLTQQALDALHRRKEQV